MGHPRWHAEHGIPYLRANAGNARTWTAGSGSALAEPLSTRAMTRIRSPGRREDRAREIRLFPNCGVRSNILPPLLANQQLPSNDAFSGLQEQGGSTHYHGVLGTPAVLVHDSKMNVR